MRNRALAAMLLAAALVLKALVPHGFMVSADNMVLTISICADGSGEHLSRTIAVPAKDPAKDPGSKSGAAAEACPYAVLGFDALSPVDPLVLALALAFLIALGFAPLSTPRHSAPLRLRPPLRGPPLAA